ncbi:hypothetical protein ACFLXI_00405 [Chloroflexota bacterium]
MKRILICTFVVVILLIGLAGEAYATPPPPFDTEPYDTDSVGNSANNLLGSF